MYRVLHLQTCRYVCYFFFFFFNDTATTEIYTLSLHDALPILIWRPCKGRLLKPVCRGSWPSGLQLEDRIGAGKLCLVGQRRSEEHTSELQSPCNLVCRLLLEKKKNARETDRER